MNTWLKTSEFWIGIATVIGQALVAFGVLPAEQWQNVMWPALVYIIARITGKAAKSLVPALIALGLLATASQALAQDDPLLSLKRVSIAAGAEYELLRDYGDPLERWFAVLPIAYNVLSPQPGTNGIRLSLTARASQSFNLDQRPEFYIGARVTLWRGAP